MTTPVHSAPERYSALLKIIGKRSSSTNIDSPFDYISIASKGLKASVLSKFQDHFKINREEVSQMLNISSPTIYRWTKADRTLDRNTAVQLLELIDLFLFGQDVFDSNEKFLQWLDFESIALGRMKPKTLLGIPGGISKVRDELGRIEYGIFS
jgi:putative toxin-antitoxin system antitoxin component (TIGR02293 family)